MERSNRSQRCLAMSSHANRVRPLQAYSMQTSHRLLAHETGSDILIMPAYLLLDPHNLAMVWPRSGHDRQLRRTGEVATKPSSSLTGVGWALIAPEDFERIIARASKYKLYGHVLENHSTLCNIAYLG